MITIKLRKSTPIELISDFSVFIYLLTLFTFNHTIISNLGIGLLAIGTLLLCVNEKRINFSYYFFCSVIFILYNFINTKLGNSINNIQSFSMINTLLLNLFITFFLFNYLVQKNNLEKFWNIFLAASGFFICFIIVLSGFNIFESRFGSLAYLRIFGREVGFNSNAIGEIIVCSIGACIYIYKTHGKRKYLIYCFIFLIILLLTGSRRGIVQGLVVTIVSAYLLYPQKRFKNALIILFVGISAYYLLMFVPVFYEIAGSRIENLLQSVQNVSLADTSITSRTDYIKLGWNYFLKKPWTGFGLDCFRFFPKAYGTYSHNNYIELLAAGGLPALILYYFPILFALLILWKYKHKLTCTSIAAALLVAQQMVEYFGITYYERIPLIVIVYSIAAIRIENESKKQVYTNILSKKILAD